MTNPTTPRRPRRWWKWLAASAALAIGLLAALPWLLTTSVPRARVAAGINRAFAPGRVEFSSLHLSWFGPTRLSDVVIYDPKGQRVLSAPSAVVGRTLTMLLLGIGGPNSITLDGASLDIERSADGTVNLGQALQSVSINRDPKRDMTIRIGRGSLRYRDPFLAEPAIADSADLTIRVAPAPNPVLITFKLLRGDSSLDVRVDIDRWLARGGPPKTPELQLNVVSRSWPIVAKTAGLDAAGRLDGTLDFLRRDGRWRFSGDARLAGLRTRGSSLSGDTLAIDRLDAGWDVSEGDEGWSIRRLSVTSPLGEIKAEGLLSGPNGAGKQRIDGRIDLAAIARQLPHALRLRDGLTVDRGTARLAIDIKAETGRSSYEIEAQVADLAARDQGRPLSLRDPATFSARLIRQAGASSVERFTVKTPFLDASASGRLQEGVIFGASLDLAGLRRQLGDWVDLGKLDLAGRAEVSGTYRSRGPGFENTWKATVRDLRVEGAGPSTVRRDLVALDVSATGPVEPSGFPRGWERVAAEVRSGDLAGRAEFRSRKGSTGLIVSATAPMTSDDPTRTVDASMDGDWSADGRSLSFTRIEVAMVRDRDGPATRRFGMAARGRLDLSSGELILDPIPGQTSAAIAIGPDGIRASGIGKGLGTLRVEGGLGGDLGVLDRSLSEWSGRPPMDLSGRWAAIATAQGDADGLQIAGKLGLNQPTGPSRTPDRPTSVALRAHYSPGADRVDLSEFTVTTAYGTLDASGRLDQPTGRRQVELRGTLAPDFGAINAGLAQNVEPGAKVEGKPRAFRASGTLGGDGAGDWLKGLDADFGFDLTAADVYGMKFGPSPVVLRAKGGRLAFDPISTSLNGGHIRLEPEVDLDAPGGPILRLAKNSAIREAQINDEVSRRVLAFVAPILDQATRASGFVSVDLDHAEFPIGAGRGRQTKVEGAVVFEDVEFAPGPLAKDLLAVIRRGDASLKLHQPVTLTIADGRVNQRGMAVPIGGVTQIELAGWVDFDRNLALTASLPVTPAMLGNNPLLSEIVAGTRVSVPVRGTLDRPVIDGDALATSLQETGKSLLTRGATRGAMELLMRLGQPRDPNAPPPPPRLTPEDRRLRRQERKAERRGEVPRPPGL